MDRSRKFSYDGGAVGKSSSAAFESRATGKFVPSFGGCAVSFGGGGVWIGALAVVMTGMGSDGARGAEQIRIAGGEVIVQDEATSVVWGMPGFIFAAGQADGVYPLSQLEREVTRRVVESRGRRAMVESEGAQAGESVRR